MAKLEWDKTGERFYETGVKKCVLYPVGSDGTYPLGVAWSGITAITDAPTGAEATPLYADDIKYLNLISTEELGATIEAYTCPEEFSECDGTASPIPGVKFGQQKRKTFGLSYVTTIGNDVESNDYGYKIHLIYGAMAAPSEKSYATINDSPEAITLSWEVTTTPVNVTGYKPTASIEIDSTKIDSASLTALEDILYGTDSETARLPLPDEIAELIGSGSSDTNTETETEPEVETETETETEVETDTEEETVG